MEAESIGREQGCGIPGNLVLISQALLTLLLLGCTTQAYAPARGPVDVETTPTPQPALPVARWQDTAEKLAAALTRGGYVVQIGQARFFGVEDCLALRCA
jgi:hypothetical protein